MIIRMLILPFKSPWRLKELCNKKSNSFMKKLYVNLFTLYQYENSSCISYSAKFASEPFFPHGMRGIFISFAVKIGKNCIIHQNTTIGSSTLIDAKKKGAPKIGDNCFIGAGVAIIGNINIGNNVRIAANASVFKDIPDNCIVVGNNKIILKEEAIDNKYYLKIRNNWEYFDDGKWKLVKDEKKLIKLNTET